VNKKPRDQAGDHLWWTSKGVGAAGPVKLQCSLGMAIDQRSRKQADSGVERLQGKSVFSSDWHRANHILKQWTKSRITVQTGCPAFQVGLDLALLEFMKGLCYNSTVSKQNEILTDSNQITVN
jgi:hypothetical protein